MIRYLILSSTLISFSGFAQDNGTASSASSAAESEYSQVVKNQLHIFNGKEYRLYKPISDEHPYYNSEDWMTTTLVYEGYTYAEVPILLDLSNNKVISQNPNTGVVFELALTKIDKITSGDDVFIKLTPTPNAEGLYRLIYNGNLKLYGRYKKKYEERIRGTTLEAEFKLKREYFVLVENNLVEVTNKASLLEALGGKKNLPRFSNKGLPHYSDNKQENTYHQMVSFYDTK